MECNEYIEKIMDLGLAGRLVFPVSQDKKPIISGWPQLATKDESQLRAWFLVNQPPNPAVVTGHTSGFFWLDVDGDEGKASLAALEERHGQLVRKCVSRTPSDGLHIYFKMPDFDLRNSAGKLGPRLDIRANGGYVLVPPGQAMNRDGQLGSYIYVTGTTLTQGELPDAPFWLLNLLREPQRHTALAVKTQRGSSFYGQKAIEDECRNITIAPEGTRNEVLNKAAFAIFQLVAGGRLKLPKLKCG